MYSGSRNRIAIIDKDLCKPTKCNWECEKICVVNAIGKICLTIKEVIPESETAPKKLLADIEDSMCIGCGACVRACPFDAVKIINLIQELPESEKIFQYSNNSFRLYRIPTPKSGKILGLLGSNGTGKSTILKIFSNNLKPNFGNFSNIPTDNEIIRYFRGTELQDYFKQLYNGTLQPIIKLQEIEEVRNAFTNSNLDGITLIEWLKKRCTVDIDTFNEIIKQLDLEKLANREIKGTSASCGISGGELQRFIIADMAVRKSNAYLIDEASAYLDIVQRMRVCDLIKSLKATYKIVIEHDLVILDYLTDYLNIISGTSSAYGVVSQPISTFDGINQYLDGYLPSENLLLRKDPINFNIKSEDFDEMYRQSVIAEYPSFNIEIGDFKLEVESGKIFNQEIIVLIGENGTGKTSLIKCLANLRQEMKLSTEFDCGLTISYKPQIIEPKFDGTVLELLEKRLDKTLYHPQFQIDVVKPINIESLYKLNVQNLSGGERQRLGIVIALGKPADLYLIDEPSAFLDSDQRMIVSRVIKKFIMNSKKTAIVVEHDFMMATYLANRVIIYQGQPGVHSKACSPSLPKDGINVFLKDIGVTFRRDPENNRPRINKKNSAKDLEQKSKGHYF